MNIEQRKYPRFSVPDNTFAALGKNFETVGKIKDISIKGLALSYLSDSIISAPDGDFSQVDIFLSKNGFRLTKMPCKIKYDIQDSKTMRNNSIIRRRCGLHFSNLSKIQSELLEFFLKKYTTGMLS
jgi:PilZ domain